MAITFQQLQDLMKGEELKFYLAPDRPVLRFDIRGMAGAYNVMISLIDDGRFLQIRSANYASCPASHPHLASVLQLLAVLNCKRRLVKFAWDEDDGELVAYADLWVMDNGVTQAQFKRMLNNYLPVIDQSYPRIAKTIETGEDPGEKEWARISLAAGAGPKGPEGLPPELREMLEKLVAGKKEAEQEKASSPQVEEI